MEQIDQYVVTLKNQKDYFTGNPEVDETDLPPEFCRYQDEGCELAPSCLNCPFPRCSDEDPQGRVIQIRIIRDREIVRLYNLEKKSLQELMARFKISRRTLFRVLAAGRIKNE